MSVSKPMPVTDDVDRAMKYKERLVTIQIKKLCFYQGNRGGQGLLPQHVQEVADSCREGVKEHRYVNVFAVKVPEKDVVAWRAAN